MATSKSGLTDLPSRMPSAIRMYSCATLKGPPGPRVESSDSSPVSRDPPAVCPLRTAHSELGDLYVRRLARVCRHDSQVALGAVDLEQEPRPVGGAAFEVDRCDRAALEDAAEEHLVGRGHLDRLASLSDLNSPRGEAIFFAQRSPE